MANDKTVSISWETVTDGRSKQGAGFRQHAIDLLAGGQELAITLADGTVRRFTEVEAFAAWFDGLGQVES